MTEPFAWAIYTETGKLVEITADEKRMEILVNLGGKLMNLPKWYSKPVYLEPPSPSPDSNVEALREFLLQRSIVGLAKYGKTTSDMSNADVSYWLNHLLEELCDASVYVMAVQQRIKERKIEIFTGPQSNG